MNCRVVGAPVELYKTVKQLPTVEAAIEEMRDQNLFLQADRTTIDYYVNVLWPEREAYKRFWEAAQGRVDGLEAPVRNLLMAWGAYTGHPVKTEGLLGGAHKEDVALLPTSSITSMKGYALVVPFQDMPGRARGYHFLANHGKQYYKELNIRPGGDTEYHDDGLAFLDRIRPGTPTVYALGDALLALQIHINYRVVRGSSDAPPVVAWGANTDYAWNVLDASRIIFWDWRPSVEMFQNIFRLGRSNAMIATAPTWHPEEDPKKITAKLARTGPAKFLAMMEQSAKPAVEVFKDYIKTNPEARGLLLTSDLNQAYRDQLLALCDSRERTIFHDLMPASQVIRTINFEGKTIEEKDDGLYLSKGTSDAFRISSVKIIPQRLLRYTKAGTTRCQGKIMMGDKEVPFDEDVRTITKKPAEWVENTVLDAGAGTSYIHRSWQHKLYDIGKLIYQPAITIVDETIGWNAKQEWWSFPNFRVREGSVEQLQAFSAPLDLPCSGLTYAEKLAPKKCIMSNDGVTAAHWAVLAVIAHNLLSSLKNWPMISMGVATPTAHRHPVIRWFVEKFNLRTFRLTRTGDVKAAEAAAAEHPVPVVVDAAPAYVKTIRSWLKTGTQANVIIPVSKQVVTTGSLYENWVFMSGMEKLTYNGSAFDGGDSIISYYLKWLQYHDHNLPVRQSTLKAVFNSLSAWAADTYKEFDISVLVEADGLLTYGDDDSNYSASYRLILTLMRLIGKHRGQFPKSRWSIIRFAKKKGEPVGLRLQTLLKTLTSLGYELPDNDVFLEAFDNAGALQSVQERYVYIRPTAWNQWIVKAFPSHQDLPDSAQLLAPQ